MQTSVDSPAGSPPHRQSRRLRWLAVAVVLLAVAAAVLFRVVAGPDGPRPLAERLSEQVVDMLEQASPNELADHGHHVEEGSQGYVCTIETFGFEPPDATQVADVEMVYAHHVCAEVGAGFDWPAAVRASGPLAVDLTTEPATVLLPSQALPGETDVNYADRIRATIPEAHHDAALAFQGSGFTDPELLAALEGRFADANR